MARSLTVKPEESPRASMLFITFVALSAGLLLLTWFTGPEAASSEPSQVVPAAEGTVNPIKTD